MKKEIIKRGLHGIPLGIAISYVISIVMSFIVGEGQFYTVALPLINRFGSEVNAVVIQTIFSAIVGSTFSMASVIWEMDDWSIAKQTGIYFGMTSLIFLPISYLMHWMERSIIGFAIYFAVFLTIFLITWVVQYLFWRNRINQINERL